MEDIVSEAFYTFPAVRHNLVDPVKIIDFLSPNRIFSPHFGQPEKQECPFLSDWERGDCGDTAAFGKIWFGEENGRGEID
jgi:hypothetical protein